MKLGKCFKKSIALLLTLVMMITAVPMSVSAYTNSYYDDYYVYTVNNGEAEITGVYADIQEARGELLIPDTLGGCPVTKIGDDIFNSCLYITKVTFPNTVLNIGSNVFSYCSDLREVVIPSSVVSIGINIFEGCDSLQSITVSENNTAYKSIDGALFSKDGKDMLAYPLGKKVVSYTVPNSVENIKDGVFEEAWYIEDINIGDNVKTIAPRAFCKRGSLRNINVSIDNSCYWSDNGVLFSYDETTLICYPPSHLGTSYYIPDTVKKIEDDVFLYCIYLDNISVGANNEYYSSIDGVVFNKDQTEIVKYPEGKNRDGQYNIPSSVEKIGCRAFENSGLTEINLPLGVNEICDYAFKSSSAYKINIPSSVTKIGVYAFSSSSITDVLIPDSVTDIKNNTFYHCDGLTNAVIGKGVQALGDYAFAHCFSLKNIEIPGNVKNIGNNAFESCSDLTGLVFSEGTQSIGNEAFLFCSGITNIKISNSITEIGVSAFDACCSVTDLDLGHGVQKIGERAFDGLEILKKVRIPSSVIFMGDYAFGDCYKLMHIYYEGTQDEWNKLIENTQTGLQTYTVIHFADTFIAAPVIVSAFSRVQDSVKITWKTVEGAEGYQIFRSEAPEGPFKCVKTVKDPNATYYTNGGLDVGKTYYYEVRAYKSDKNGNWIYSDFSSMDYMPAAVNFTFLYSNAPYRIRILWTAVNGAQGYQLWRAESPEGPYKIVKTVNDGKQDVYSNTGLEAGKTYYYKMRAYYTKASGEKIFGAYSDIKAVAAMPNAPIVSVYSNSAFSARIKWESVNGAAGYQIWRADESGKFTLVKSVTDPNAIGYTNRDLESGKVYTFKVRAYTEVNGKKTFGAYSEPQNITVR